MKSSHVLSFFTVGLALAAGLGLTAATVEPIVMPGKRAEVLERARAMLAEQAPPDKVANPFFSETYAEILRGGTGRPAEEQSSGNEAARPVTPDGGIKTSRGLLESIASSLRPSGYFVIGGQPTLVFGQKRVKAGGLLTITFEGKEYTLEVVALDRTNFTLRLDREEFTRPIK